MSTLGWKSFSSIDEIYLRKTGWIREGCNIIRFLSIICLFISDDSEGCNNFIWGIRLSTNFQLSEINGGRKKERKESIKETTIFFFFFTRWTILRGYRSRSRGGWTLRKSRFESVLPGSLENVGSSIRSKVTESRNRDESIAKKRRRRIFDGCAKLRKSRDRNHAYDSHKYDCRSYLWEHDSTFELDYPSFTTSLLLDLQESSSRE